MACSRCCQWLSGRPNASVNAEITHPMLPTQRADDTGEVSNQSNVELADTEGIVTTEDSGSPIRKSCSELHPAMDQPPLVSTADPPGVKTVQQTEAQASETQAAPEPCKSVPFNSAVNTGSFECDTTELTVPCESVQTNMAIAENAGTFKSDTTVSTVQPDPDSFKMSDSDLASGVELNEGARIEVPPSYDTTDEMSPHEDTTMAATEVLQDPPQLSPSAAAADATEAPTTENAAPVENCQDTSTNVTNPQTEKLSECDLTMSNVICDDDAEAFQSFTDAYQTFTDNLPQDQAHLTAIIDAIETRTPETAPAIEDDAQADPEDKSCGSPRSTTSDRSKQRISEKLASDGTAMSFVSAMSDEETTPRM